MLSLGGRLSLLKAVLIGISIFWFSLDQIPQTILNMLRKLLFNFLWFGNVDGGEIHLESWERLSRPKSLVGWDIKNLEWFSTSLSMKSLWWGLFGIGLGTPTKLSEMLPISGAVLVKPLNGLTMILLGKLEMEKCVGGGGSS